MLEGVFGLAGIKFAKSLATKTAIKIRSSGLLANELTRTDQQVIRAQQQCFSNLDQSLFLSGVSIV